MRKLSMAVGFAAGYVLGAKAGKERYQQITDATKQLMERPQVKRVTEQASAKVNTVKQRATTAASGSPDGPPALPPDPTVVPTVDAAAMPPDPTILPPQDAAAMPPDPTVPPGEPPSPPRRRRRRSRDRLP